MATDAPVCALCACKVDDTKADVSVVTCSVSGCDKDAVYHADCTRELQLSKKSEYLRRLSAVMKHKSPASQNLMHCVYAGAAVPVQCMHGVEHRNTSHQGAYTGCPGTIVASKFLRKIAEAKEAPKVVNKVAAAPVKAVVKRVFTPLHRYKPAEAPASGLATRQLNLALFLPSDPAEGHGGRAPVKEATPHRVPAQHPSVPASSPAPVPAAGVWGNSAQTIKELFLDAAHAVVETAVVETKPASPAPMPAVVQTQTPPNLASLWPGAYDDTSEYEPKGFALMPKPVWSKPVESTPPPDERVANLECALRAAEERATRLESEVKTAHEHTFAAESAAKAAEQRLHEALVSMESAFAAEERATRMEYELREAEQNTIAAESAAKAAEQRLLEAKVWMENVKQEVHVMQSDHDKRVAKLMDDLKIMTAKHDAVAALVTNQTKQQQYSYNVAHGYAYPPYYYLAQ